jgi:hypothetical protein
MYGADHSRRWRAVSRKKNQGMMKGMRDEG